jgi:hypothetical protein
MRRHFVVRTNERSASRIESASSGSARSDGNCFRLAQICQKRLETEYSLSFLIFVTCQLQDRGAESELLAETVFEVFNHMSSSRVNRDSTQTFSPALGAVRLGPPFLNGLNSLVSL